MKIFEQKSEPLLNDYKNFEKKYKKQWELLRNKIILDKSFSSFETLKTLLEDFDIEGNKLVNDTIETSLYGIVHINLIVYLLDMWVIWYDDLNKYYNQLINWDRYLEMPYYLDFYMLHAISRRWVSFYIIKWSTVLLQDEEFYELKRTYNFSTNFISISLNSMLYKIGIESAIHITSKIRELWDKELQILEEIRDINPGKIGIDITFWKDWKTPKKMETTKVVKAEDMNQIYKIAQEIWTGKIKEVPIDNGKYFSWKVSKTTKFDK